MRLVNRISLSFFAIVATCGLFAVLSACGAKDIDKVGDAQMCLDTATKNNVSSCTDYIAGIETTSAYNVRCAANFIKEGLGTTELMTSLTSLDSGASGINSFLDKVTFASESTIAANNEVAATTFDYCFKSSGKGATMLSAYTYLSTTLYQFLSTCSTSCPDAPTSGAYSVTTCFSGAATAGCAIQMIKLIDATTSDTSVSALQTTLGDIVIKTYSMSCTGNGANRTLCGSFSNAITAAGGTSNKRSVGVNFLGTLVSH